MKRALKSIVLVCILSIPSLSKPLVDFLPEDLLSDIKWESGVGVNYGGLLGITANKKVSDEVELYAGLAAVGAVAGARYYPIPNVRLNLSYGTQGLLAKEEVNGDKVYEIFHGLNVGVDYVWENGLSLGLVYYAYSNMDDKMDEAENQGYTIDRSDLKVGVSLGYRF